MQVVGAALLRDDPPRVLSCRRTAPPAPGRPVGVPGRQGRPGRVRPRRPWRASWREELGVRAEVGERLGPEVDLAGTAVLRVYLATLLDGDEPALLDHDAHRWLTAQELDDVPWIDVDRPVVEALRALLSHARVTPEHALARLVRLLVRAHPLAAGAVEVGRAARAPRARSGRRTPAAARGRSATPSSPPRGLATNCSSDSRLTLSASSRSCGRQPLPRLLGQVAVRARRRRVPAPTPSLVCQSSCVQRSRVPGLPPARAPCRWCSRRPASCTPTPPAAPCAPTTGRACRPCRRPSPPP